MSEEAKPAPARKPRAKKATTAKKTPAKTVVETEVVELPVSRGFDMRQVSDVLWGLVALVGVICVFYIGLQIVDGQSNNKPDVVVVEDAAMVASQAFVEAYRKGLSGVYAEAAKGKFKDLQEVNDFLKPKRQKVIDEAFQPIAKELESLNGDKFNEDKFRKVFEGLSKGFVE